MNFSPRWALDVTADRYRRSGAPGTLDERIVLFQVRAAIAESRRGLRLSGLFGGGIDFTRYDFPAYEGISYDPRTYGQPRMYPEESLSHRRALVLAGLGLSRPISPHVSVHSEVKFFPFERYGFGVRATVGVTAAVGRFPPASKTTWLSVAPDRPIRIGQRMWVTLADGTQITGGMLSTTPSSLTIARDGRRETIPVTSLARVDVLESPTVARTRWMAIGGLSGLGLGAAMTASWVASNGGEGADAFGIWGPGLATLGIVAGGLVGGEIDRRRSVRRTIFDVSRPALDVRRDANRRASRPRRRGDDSLVVLYLAVVPLCLISPALSFFSSTRGVTDPLGGSVAHSCGKRHSAAGSGPTRRCRFREARLDTV